jgi:tRNA(Arg) A34 adenosine deaminase TadA
MLSAVIVRGGNVISFGHNKAAKNGICARYGKWFTHTHAEMDAISQARRSDLKGATMYVARRLRLNGSLALARPCEICQKVLRDYGIRKAVYTISDTEYGVLEVLRTEAEDETYKVT